ncbi:MAG: SIMPL domain-containing protein [Sedimentisphaerales bacterium]|nr:SIMPL domain-containing protein [Sedimentisphaerales bacterium]
MKSIIYTAVGLILLSGTVVLAAEGSPVRSISVTGTIETKTAPDHILWQITLTDTDVNMLEAKKRNDEKVKAVVALQEKLGIAEGDLETGQVSVNREYERNTRAFKHFLVRRGVTIRQRDLKRFDEFLDSLVSSTEMEVWFSFESSSMYEVRAETRLKALKAAQEKAKAMAEVVGARIGRVLTINEHAQADQRQGSMLSNTAWVQSTPPTVDLASDKFVPGAITVKVTVYATFELE